MEEEETNEIKRAVIDEINNIHDVLKGKAPLSNLHQQPRIKVIANRTRRNIKDHVGHLKNEWNQAMSEANKTTNDESSNPDDHQLGSENPFHIDTNVNYGRDAHGERLRGSHWHNPETEHQLDDVLPLGTGKKDKPKTSLTDRARGGFKKLLRIKAPR